LSITSERIGFVDDDHFEPGSARLHKRTVGVLTLEALFGVEVYLLRLCNLL